MPASKIVYSTKATATGGGRDGTSKTHDGALDLKMAPPTEMGGSGDGVNPEQLFAAGYAACFSGGHARLCAWQEKLMCPAMRLSPRRLALARAMITASASRSRLMYRCPVYPMTWPMT